MCLDLQIWLEAVCDHLADCPHCCERFLGGWRGC